MPRIPIIFADAISAAGSTIPQALETLFQARQPFEMPTHFDAHDTPHGLCELPPYEHSRSFALLDIIVGRLPKLPEDTHLFLASTVGAIDLLERQTDDEPLDCLQILLNYAQERTGLRQATLVAAACASGQNAIALACGEIAAGDCRNALVIGIDITSEFVTAGFTSLGAVSRSLPRPYSVERDGLLLGEGCGALLLAEQAQDPLATVIGTTSSCDASHITAPDLAGTHLAKTIRDCLAQANLEADQLGAILGHGTGTFYNDQAELAALNAVVPTALPLFSLKANTGHTMGASGVLQIAYAPQLMKHGKLPPSAGVITPEDSAREFLEKREIKSPFFLSLNIGFGGLNSAIILEVAQ